jgi:hypothetical protein
MKRKAGLASPAVEEQNNQFASVICSSPAKNASEKNLDFCRPRSSPFKSVRSASNRHRGITLPALRFLAELKKLAGDAA